VAQPAALALTDATIRQPRLFVFAHGAGDFCLRRGQFARASRGRVDSPVLADCSRLRPAELWAQAGSSRDSTKRRQAGISSD
jgi:hypothetical protein